MRVLLLSLLFVTGCVATPRTETVERRLLLMGTSLEIAIEAENREAALVASEEAVQALEAAEARLSTWREDTELARLNRALAGEAITLSPALADDLASTLRCWKETDGAFNPGIGALVRAWGLREGGRVPSQVERRAAVAAGSLESLLLENGTVVRQSPDLVLEEGGFGKGAGLADALKTLADAPGVSRASLDLGGQVAVVGEDWIVPVADPRWRDRTVAEIVIDGGSISTSGTSEKGRHILDPRTGEPAPAFGSVTVWTADPLRADCLSTGLYVLGPERALEWAAAHPGVEVLVLQPQEDRLKALASPGLKGRLKTLSSELRIEFHN